MCWTLRALFRLPVSGPQLTFKGGTSLSKGWKLIDRFSEDIDIVIDREFLGFGGAEAPEDASSNRQRVTRIEALTGAAQAHIRDVLGPALEQEIRQLLPPKAAWTLEADADDPDAQTLLFHYPSAMGATAYVRPVVKIELGARSDTEPSATPEIAPYLADVFPDEVPGSRFSVHVGRRDGRDRACLPAARRPAPEGLCALRFGLVLRHDLSPSAAAAVFARWPAACLTESAPVEPNAIQIPRREFPPCDPHFPE